nr:elongation of very long chain fatty acids protein AAEL008004-like isoform X1 [Danaus plexippus plexippus]
METVAAAYNTVFYERADPRVKTWWLMTSPWPLAAIIVAYLTTIKVFLPAYMTDRKAFELRLLIKWYNVIQIIANAVVTWGILTSGWTTTYHFGCMLPDYSMNPEALRMLSFLWWTIILKLFELFETVFFLLRKKEKQASFLHIYHHVSTLIIIWSAVKYVGVCPRCAANRDLVKVYCPCSMTLPVGSNYLDVTQSWILEVYMAK